MSPSWGSGSEWAPPIAGQATKRALANLTTAISPSETELRLIEQLGTAVCDNQAMMQKHPIDI